MFHERVFKSLVGTHAAMQKQASEHAHWLSSGTMCALLALKRRSKNAVTVVFNMGLFTFISVVVFNSNRWRYFQMHVQPKKIRSKG